MAGVGCLAAIIETLHQPPRIVEVSGGAWYSTFSIPPIAGADPLLTEFQRNPHLFPGVGENNLEQRVENGVGVGYVRSTEADTHHLRLATGRTS